MYDAVNLFINFGASPDKLTLGLAAYGRGFTLNNESENGLYCEIKGSFPEGPYTKEQGVMGFVEIQQLLTNTSYSMLNDSLIGGWVTVVDDCYQTPYMHNQEYWIGYDDLDSIDRKVRFANFLELGGAMFWALDLDDFTGNYSDGLGNYPILNKINDVLESAQVWNPYSNVCGSAPMCDPFH